MVTGRRGLERFVGAIVVAGALALAGCAPSLPRSPAAVGEGHPASGIPTDVAWPSDWLEGFVGEPNSPPGPIVGLRLEYVEAEWVWRVRSQDPGRDIWDESVTEPDRGAEALYDASTLARLQEHHVTLTDSETAELGVGAYDAARLSGEVYPSPRLIELQRVVADGQPTWRITTYDAETGALSTAVVGALPPDEWAESRVRLPS